MPPRGRHPFRSALIAFGIILLASSATYLVAGFAGWVPLEMERVTWNNIRVVSGLSILGCLAAAVGYGNE